MPRYAGSRILATLLLVAVAGGLSVASAPTGTHIGNMWPVGLATGVFLLGSRRQVLPLGVVLYAVTAATFLPGNYPLEVALLFSATTVVEAWLVQDLIPRRPDGVAWLMHGDEFLRYALACLAGAALGGLGFGLVSSLTGFGNGWQVGTAAFATHLASQLILVPFFLHIPPMVLRQQRREQVIRWLVAAATAGAAVVPSHLPSLIFLVMPALAWTAVRAPTREIQLHLLTVASAVSMATALGVGPFDELVHDNLLSTELARVPMQAFIISCVLVCIPFAMAVRRQRESAREAATEKSRSERLIESAHGLAIVGTDDLGRITLFNPGAERILGYTAQEVYGESPEMFHSDEALHRLADHLGCRPDFFGIVGALLERRGEPVDWEFVRKDGERRILSFVINPVFDDGGHVLGFLATADDVTERIRKQQMLEAALAQAVEAESVATRRLGEVDRAKDSFVSAVSHELRTPITSLMGYLEMLQDGSYGQLNPEQSTALDRVSLNSARLLSLIDDLLTLSRIEHLELSEAPSPTDMTEIVQKVGLDLQHLVEARHLRVDVQTPEAAVVVNGDTGQLHRMVTNLADNAAKFTPDGGRITLRLQCTADRCVLEVSDTGVGIPEDQQAYVFERFFRSSTADDEAVPGTGIGLFVAKAIAEAHGATISFDSEAGVGTTFRVVLEGAQVAPGAP